MRYSKQELSALASQTSQYYEREGVLFLKEKLDGFFRRSEGCSARWFRLRGNLLFYLKGPNPWHEPMGVIFLGYHKLKELNQDENGYWPFHIVWDNGLWYRLAAFNESEQKLWIKVIQNASHSSILTQFTFLQEKLNNIRSVEDIATYRLKKGITVDITEIPLCEMALSCDNLLCDAYGKPPSSMIVVYVRYSKDVCIKYGTTEIVETCSNPCFSKTIHFRVSDGLTDEAMVRIVVYAIKERVTETAVPMGFTSLHLSTIQEAQRLRVALMTHENKTIGFVTIHGWSLEPSYIGTSPKNSNDKNYTELPQKKMRHRRSQSLPPRLGLKLKFPSYSNLIKQNFVNGHQVTYKFHSGLGADITVHEIMAESKLCYQLPVQLLEIFIQLEYELLEELLSVGDINQQLQTKQLDLASTHISLIKHYNHCKRCLRLAENPYFKASCKKDEACLDFAPVNLHLQRMWVHNDTLNKTGFHDIITAGAFTAHTHKAEKTGGLIRLVQQVKDINSTRSAFVFATANKIQAEYCNVVALRRLSEEISNDIDRILVLLQANQKAEIVTMIEGVKGKLKSIIALWQPCIIEEMLTCIGRPKNNIGSSNNEKLSTILHLTEQLITFDLGISDSHICEASSSCSSKEPSPTCDVIALSKNSTDIRPGPSTSIRNDFSKSLNDGAVLQFHNYLYSNEIQERRKFTNSFRSDRSPVKIKTFDAKSLLPESEESCHFSIQSNYKKSSFEESYKSFIDGLYRNKETMFEEKLEDTTLPKACLLDFNTKEINPQHLKLLGTNIEILFAEFVSTLQKIENSNVATEELGNLRLLVRKVKNEVETLVRWARVSHAALRIRCESPLWSKEHAVLQTRRDICFSQALTTTTAGLLCWFNSMSSDIILKLLNSDLGPLCSFEGLLSLYSTEKDMWEDMVVAIEDLQTVMFTLTKVSHSNSALPQVKGTRSSLSVNIPISDSLHSKFTRKDHLSFTITAVFFNIGINDKATLAESLGETAPQYHSNCDNLNRLNKYYQKYNKIFPTDLMTATRASSRMKSLEEVMENLRIVVHKKVPKNVEVLHLASLATRVMNGIRFTSCKSAKDRTGMSVTLEQCSILATDYHLAENEVKKALSIMRSEGCRRENTFKNIGVRKYAFTKKQLMALPDEYRPPSGTYGSTQT